MCTKRVQDFVEVEPDLDVTKIELPTSKKRGRPTVLPLKHLDMCFELIDSLRLKGAVISGSVIKEIVVGIIEAKFSNLMEKEDVNYENVRQVLQSPPLSDEKNLDLYAKSGEKTSKIWEKSNKWTRKWSLKVKKCD